MRRIEEALGRAARRSHRRGLGIGAVVAALAIVALSAPAGASAATQSFTAPGSSTFAVPAGVTSISVEAFGAAGGSSGDGKAGGLGAAAHASTVPVTGGESLTVVVGGQGGNGVNGTSGFCDWGAGGLNGAAKQVNATVWARPRVAGAALPKSGAAARPWSLPAAAEARARTGPAAPVARAVKPVWPGPRVPSGAAAVAVARP